MDNIQKTEDGEDRFDEFAMGVKRKYRPDWLDSENKLFINKLNHVAKNYDGDHKAVSAFFILTMQVKNLKNAVYNMHKPQLHELEVNLRDLKEDHKLTRSKLESVEENLPRMVREMIDFYIEQTVMPKFADLVSKENLSSAMLPKLDYAVFSEYVRK